MPAIIGWIAWGIVTFLAIAWTYGCRKSVASGVPPQWGTAVLTLFWWIVAGVFLISGANKLHIFWAAPLAFFLSFLVSPPLNIPFVSPLVLMATRIFMSVVTLGIKKQS
jgi:hypothetical protein